MVPIFLFSGFVAGKESKAIKGLGTVLDEKIPIDSLELTQNSFIFDSEGQLISEITTNQQNRIYTNFEEIPEVVKSLFVTSEDQRFFEHIGFDPAGMIRAVFINAKSQDVEQGGSTITQQLARNAYLSHEKTYNRKLSELLYSYQLERNMSKEQILEGYLNAIYFGNGAYGIGTAATYYFSKQLQELNLAELVFISAIPNNPTLYNPVDNFENTKKRQERLLTMLFEEGHISKEALAEATSYPVSLNIQGLVDAHPDYVTFVHQELKQLISKSEGIREAAAEKKLNEEAIQAQVTKRVNDVINKGVIIHTALNSTIQSKLENAVDTHLPYKDIQGAASVIDHEAHRIVALYGGKKYEKFGFNRAYQAYRQPGSAIKPLLDYAPYIDVKGTTAKTKIDASEFCKDDYCPKNYSEKNYGIVTTETALKYSYNAAAVRLLDRVGLEKAYSYLEPFGFASVTAGDKTRLTTAIGGFDVGVSPLELTSAYTTFANDGQYYKNRAITKVTDLSGNTLYEWNEEPPVQVWKKSTNNEMRSLLASVVKTGTGQKASVSGEYVGGKTGTTNDYRDLWFVGLKDQYTAGIWVGKDSSGNVEHIYPKGPAMLIWRDTLK
ncbi:penicillin-binding protein 1A [Metabacillus malikii]|uniref:Penicillin-binding protein 1A n=2 Tax=Metabacillus malikii TaxID=1504265 RepID=A0ABT9ZC17_9BACI|nr:penicillin-binding protein 1A [Metabacillus malikii]